jgi:hypothetical protein
LFKTSTVFFFNFADISRTFPFHQTFHMR